jgi:aminoglycoside/choline kinase family phosphotransferase
VSPESGGAELEAAIRRLVRDALGRDPEAVQWLPGALGLRRFARVRTGLARPAHLIARVERPEDPAGRPPGIPPEPPLEPIRALLERAGLPVPARYGGDPQRGIELLEDAGDTSLCEAASAADRDERMALYREACGLIPRLQRVADPGGVAAFERRLDAPYFRYKARLFAEHGLAAGGRRPTPAETACVERAFEAIGREVARAPQRLAHRDLQSQNLLVRRAAPHGERLCLIDLQGALLAAPEYDLVCLLRDSYVELDPAEIDALFERTRAALPDAPEPELARWRFDALTLTRKGKDYARFLYVASERGDHRYLRYLPATRRHLRAAAARLSARDAAFGPLAELIHALPEPACGP